MDTPSFANYIKPTSGQIVADMNFKYGANVSNSEVLWQQWKSVVDLRNRNKSHWTRKTNYSNLKELYRKGIVNEDTVKIVYMCHSDDRVGEKKWLPNSDEFNALLGSPNGKSAYYILKDHHVEMKKHGYDNIKTKLSGSQLLSRSLTIKHFRA